MKRYFFCKRTHDFLGESDIIPDRIPSDLFFDSEEIVFPELKEGEKICYDELNGYKIISKKDWRILQSKLGNEEPIPATSKIDDSGEIVSKTKKELYSENLIDKEEYIEYLSSLLTASTEKKKAEGIIYKNHVFACDEISINRISNAIIEAQVFPKDIVTAWISEYKVDDSGKKIPGTDNSPYQINSLEDLKELAKVMKDYWKQLFFIRRNTADSWKSLNKTQLLAIPTDD